VEVVVDFMWSRIVFITTHNMLKVAQHLL